MLEAEHFKPQRSALAIFDVATDRDVLAHAALCSRILREASAELDKMTLSYYLATVKMAW